MAITTPDAVPGEVIEAAWGDAVRADLQSHETALGTKVSKAGDKTTGPIYIGTNADVPNNTGIQLRDTGPIITRLNDPSALSEVSVKIERAGTSAAVGGKYIVLARAGTSGSAAVESGSISITTGGATAFNTSSDERLKDVTGDADADDLAAAVEALRVVGYVWKADDTHTELVGFLAHEVADVIPEAVTGERDATDADGNIVPQQLDRSALVPYLVGAVQALMRRVAELEAAAA